MSHQDAQFLLSSGLSLQVTGNAVVVGVALGDLLIGYYHPETFKASMTFYDVTLFRKVGSLSGSFTYESGPRTWGTTTGYPATRGYEDCRIK